MGDWRARRWWWLKGASSGPQPHRAACCSPTSPGRREGGYGDEGLPCHAGTSSGPGDKKPGAVPDSGWFSVSPEAGHLRAWVPSSLRRENIHCPAYHM